MSSNIIELAGHSGFEVILYERKKNFYVVRKKAKSIEQNARLKRQYQKHKFFKSLKQDKFFVPEILDAGFKAKLFYYEYKYVEGVTLIHFIEHHPINKILVVLKKIAAIVKSFQSEKKAFEAIGPGQTLGSALKKKIGSILSFHPNSQKIAKLLLKKLKTLEDFKDSTICHGDLTFDNIIVDSNLNVWLIDFLDSFYPHYWFDITRLFGDIDGRWHEIKYGIRLPQNKLIYLRELFLNSVRAFDSRYESYNNFLLAVSFLRTLPYAKTEEERRLIISKIDYFLSIKD